jgi:hypothetical protein
MVEVESVGIIISTRYKIETALKERKAFDLKTATNAAEAKINFNAVLEVMEKSGLIGKTPEGKIFMTQKGQEKQIRGFSINGKVPTYEKIVKFSRNR